MDSIFVDKRDLDRYTAPAKTKAEKVQVLIQKGVPFDINGAGDILVLKSTLEYALSGKARRKTQKQHNFGSV